MAAVVVLAVIAIFGLVRWRQLWSGVALPKPEDGTPGWWSYGYALRRGFVRGMPLGVVACWLLLISIVAQLIDDRLAQPEAILRRVASGSVVLLLVVFLLDVSVALFNRPKWAVPRPFREEAGAVAMWVRALRRR